MSLPPLFVRCLSMQNMDEETILVLLMRGWYAQLWTPIISFFAHTHTHNLHKHTTQG